MFKQTSPRTIIQNIGAYADYPFEAIDKPLLRELQEFGERADIKVRHRVLKAFECFLQITNQTVSRSTLRHKTFPWIYRGFIGALYSESFFFVRNPRTRYVYVRGFQELLSKMQEAVPDIKIPALTFRLKGLSPDALQCIVAFESCELDSFAAEIWRGWPSQNKTGRVTWFPLYPVYKRLGLPFATQLHEACDEYFRARKCQRVIAIPELSKFIEQYPSPISAESFSSPAFIAHFWRQFLLFYVRCGVDSGADISTLITNWRNEFTFFVSTYLVLPGRFAEPFGAFPMPTKKKRLGSQTHIKKNADGAEIKTKLITHIPLQLTDAEALELLFKTIESDINLAVDWARWATKDMWSRYQRRVELSSKGRARKIGTSSLRNKDGGNLTDRENPEYLQNACATFSHFGFQTLQDNERLQLLYPEDLSRTAYELALPVASSLLPHCVLLVANHPIITPSFLENFTLYDDSGRLAGFAKVEDSFVLDGSKSRRGPELSQQVVVLTTETKETVEQIIALTQPLREYLKARGDDSWRRLLITCGSGFAYPKALRRIAQDTSIAPRKEALAESLKNVCDWSLAERLSYTDRFSLPALRASKGVLIYIQSRDVRKMAEALGHAEYDYKLLSRYLPEPILAFFQERWIRIFQSGVIAEALKSSKYLLEATDFSSMDELHSFLENHALKKIPNNLLNPSAEADGKRETDDGVQSEVIIGVNEETLTLLLSVKMAVDQSRSGASGKAIYWAELATHIETHLESPACQRDDLKDYLRRARLNATADKVSRLVHA